MGDKIQPKIHTRIKNFYKKHINKEFVVLFKNQMIINANFALQCVCLEFDTEGWCLFMVIP